MGFDPKNLTHDLNISRRRVIYPISSKKKKRKKEGNHPL